MGKEQRIQKIKAGVAAGQIQGVVTDLMIALNKGMSRKPIQKVLDAIPGAMEKAFANVRLKAQGSVSIVLGVTPEEFRIYFFRWEKLKDGYLFSVEAAEGIALNPNAAELAGPELVTARNLIHEYFKQKGIVSKDAN